MPAPTPSAAPRPFLRLVTQTLQDPAAPHGDLEDRLYAVERFAMDLDRHATTPGLKTLAAAFRDLTRGLVDAAQSRLPHTWEQVLADHGAISDPTTLGERLSLVDTACETLEEAGFEDFPDADASERETWAKGVKETADTLKEIREYAGAELDDEDLVKWVIDQTAYEERAEQYGGLGALLNAAEDGVVATVKGAIADEASPDAPEVESGPSRETLLARAEAAERAIAHERTLTADAKRVRDEALGEASELRTVVANIRRALGDLAASLPADPNAAPPPTHKPSLPVASDMLSAIGTDGTVVDTPAGRFAIAESRFFGLMHLGITTPEPRVVCALGDPDVGNLTLAAETLRRYAYATPLAVGTVGKLPKTADAPEDCVAVALDEGATKRAYFSLKMLRTVMQGSKHARIHVVAAEGRPGEYVLVVLIGGFRGGVMFGRGAPEGEDIRVPLIGVSLGEEGESTGPAGQPLLPTRSEVADG